MTVPGDQTTGGDRPPEAPARRRWPRARTPPGRRLEPIGPLHARGAGSSRARPRATRRGPRANRARRRPHQPEFGLAMGSRRRPPRRRVLNAASHRGPRSSSASTGATPSSGRPLSACGTWLGSPSPGLTTAPARGLRAILRDLDPAVARGLGLAGSTPSSTALPTEALGPSPSCWPHPCASLPGAAAICLAMPPGAPPAMLALRPYTPLRMVLTVCGQCFTEDPDREIDYETDILQGNLVAMDGAVYLRRYLPARPRRGRQPLRGGPRPLGVPPAVARSRPARSSPTRPATSGRSRWATSTASATSRRSTRCILLLDVTENCNLDCPTCFAAAGPGIGRLRPPAPHPAHRSTRRSSARAARSTC